MTPLFDQTTDTGNIGIDRTTLCPCIVPADTLQNDGDKIIIDFSFMITSPALLLMMTLNDEITELAFKPVVSNGYSFFGLRFIATRVDVESIKTCMWFLQDSGNANGDFLYGEKSDINFSESNTFLLDVINSVNTNDQILLKKATGSYYPAA